MLEIQCEFLVYHFHIKFKRNNLSTAKQNLLRMGRLLTGAALKVMWVSRDKDEGHGVK